MSYAQTDTEYVTTGTFWGNVCGEAENVMPNPIPPDDSYGYTWGLMSTQVVLVDKGEMPMGAPLRAGRTWCSLFITWTWRRQ